MSFTTESKKIFEELNISKVPSMPKDNAYLQISENIYHDILKGYKEAQRLESTNKISVERIHFKEDNSSHKKEMLQKLGMGS